MKPKTRRSGLLIRELPDELLVYDQEQHRAHCLNRTAALVFRNADGTRTLLELARLTGVDEEAVALAVEQLGSASLLEAATPQAAPPERLNGPVEGMTRRQIARRMGMAAAILLPAVVTIVAPTPAEAAATCVTDCDGQANGTRCDVCGAGANCATTPFTCVSQDCEDTCPDP
jgi:hypothetical protein